MKLKDVKQKIDDYFDSVTSEEIAVRLNYQVTRGNYFYIKHQNVVNIEAKKRLCFYTYVDENKTIVLNESIILDFEDKFDDENILKMVEIENIEGFMFWNCSKAGKKWFQENWLPVYSTMQLF